MEWKNVNNEKPEKFFNKNSDGDEISESVFLHNGADIATGHYNFTKNSWISIPKIEGISSWVMPTVPQMHIDNIKIENYIEKLKNLEPGKELIIRNEDVELYHAIESRIRLHKDLMLHCNPLKYSFTASDE